MWLSKPIYEGFPFYFIALGLVCLLAAFRFEGPYLPELAAAAGAVALILGLVLLLRRKGYRSSRSRIEFDEAD